ncbi:unnamed protein product [Staurois parvus]|uniref:Uncharacterized protein n=1 Tax=Staurois parvus TaxID=386267 RepID=A0ABN9GYV2_9NEOB|nr:unnamed protein product [Staurois parvus]
MISVAPAVPPVSVHQCHVSVLIHAICQCPSVPHFSAHLSCLSVSPISAMSISAMLVPPISAIYQCCLSVPISDAYQCPSVPPTSASSSVPPISVHQCSLSMPITAASLAHISEGEKSLIYKTL